MILFQIQKWYPFVNESIMLLCENPCTVVGDQKRNKEKIFEPGLGARDKRKDMERKKIVDKMCKSWWLIEWESEDVGEQEWLHCSSPRLP